MKKLFTSYTTLTRPEQLGLLAMGGALMLLIGIRATMAWWVHPVPDPQQQQRLMAAAQILRRAQPARVLQEPAANGAAHSPAELPAKIKDFQDAGDPQATPLPDTIDINAADSATIVRLKGIGPATAHKVIVVRAHAPITSMHQLTGLGHFSHATIALLSPHLRFGSK